MEKAEIEKIEAEKDKILAEKEQIELESKNYWRKPLISGFSFAITIAGLFIFLHSTLYSHLREVNQLEISRKDYDNTKTSDSLTVKNFKLKSLNKELLEKQQELEIKERELEEIKDNNDTKDNELSRRAKELLASQKQNSSLRDSLKRASEVIIALQDDINRKQSSSNEVNDNVVLWVDDNPSNNQRLIDYLNKEGIQLELVRSTSKALYFIDNNPVNMIISDMGRTEGGVYNSKAGFALIDEVNNIPILIYSSSANSNKKIKSELLERNIPVTSNPSEVLTFIRN